MRYFGALLPVLLLVSCQEPGATKRLGILRALSLAARQGDSVSLSRLIADSLVSQRLSAVRRLDPRILDAMSRIEDAEIISQSGDTTRVTYRMSVSGSDEALSVGFIGSGESMKVYYIGFPDRQ